MIYPVGSKPTSRKVSTGKPPHGCRNQIAPRLPDKFVLWASWDEYNNVDIDIGVDDDVAADG